MSGGDQLDLLTGRKPPERRPAGATVPAGELPVARVVVESGVPHLDRAFDYVVPEDLAGLAMPGARCVVRLAGRKMGGFIVERLARSDHDGRLQPLLQVPSSIPVLAPDVLATCRQVARTHAGVLADVLRLAVPPRHGRTEKTFLATTASAAGSAAAPVDVTAAEPGEPETAAAEAPPRGGDGTGSPTARVPDPGEFAGTGAIAPGPWRLVVGGEAFLSRVADGQHPRAVCLAPPGFTSAPRAGTDYGTTASGGRPAISADRGRPPATDPAAAPTGGDADPAGVPRWTVMVAAATATARRAGRGVLVVVPDGRDLELLGTVLVAAGVGPVARLSADLGPAARYRNFLQARTGQAPVVIGTRAAAFAPVADLGLIICLDDTDPLLAEPRAPYPQARDILVARAQVCDAALVLLGAGCSVEAMALVDQGWARLLAPARPTLRDLAPRVLTAADDEHRDPAARLARIPSLMLRTAREGLEHGPVLVQVPRAGYVSRLVCARCQTPALCGQCRGPLRLRAAGAAPVCSWCGRAHPARVCPQCSATEVRWLSVGSERTGEELGRALPGVSVKLSTSTADEGVRSRVSGAPALVVATTGAEPLPPRGYAAALILDAGVHLASPMLDAPVQALRRWLAAASLVRPAVDGGRVVIAADPGLRPVQAFLRWDPAGLATRELADRAELGLPPAAVLAEVTGEPGVLAAFRSAVRLPDEAVLVEEPPEPGTDPPQARLLIRAPAALAGEVARALAQARSVTSVTRGATLPRLRMRATV